MQGLLTFFQQYLPELERVMKKTKTTSFRFKGKEFKLKPNRKGRMKRTKLDPATKIARTVFRSMQAHVDRLTKNSKRFKDLASESAIPITTEAKIVKPSRSKVPRIKKYSSSKITAEKTNSSVNEKKLHSKTRSKLTRQNSSSSVASKTKKVKSENKKSRRSKIADAEKSDIKNILEMKREEFLRCLKNLQDELSALKVPDFNLPQKDLVSKDKKKSTNTATKKKSTASKKRKDSKAPKKKSEDWCLNRELSSQSMFSSDDYDFEKHALDVRENLKMSDLGPGVYPNLNTLPQPKNRLFNTIRQLAEAYNKPNSMPNTISDINLATLELKTDGVGDGEMNASDFFEWAQRPLKGIKFPDGVA
ncbi:micronuclear linker histone polyprotein-like [Cimex lectularius]|uniref:Uncharacterized protein n=1 Tax=Cimex lectularius TaxID=79782 RepID=A0A8I6RTV5_CIMLE|nr:micronuclear linker histone polyprotein-like [Cimex lectularius]